MGVQPVVSIDGNLYYDGRTAAQKVQRQYAPAIPFSKISADPQSYGYFPLGSVSATGSKAAGSSTPLYTTGQATPSAYTPNPYTAQQLQGFGGGSVPQWMYDAYSAKIGKMGGNAAHPPFAINQTGFPGAGGKSSQGAAK